MLSCLKTEPTRIGNRGRRCFGGSGPVAKASLLVIQGVDQGARFELGEEPVAVGRGVHNQVRILDTEVSRQHAAIEYQNGAYILTDRGSSNGTFVNGVPIRTRRLVHGDRIQIGRSTILFTHSASGKSRADAAEKVALVPSHDAQDRSSIVGEMQAARARELMAEGGYREGSQRLEEMANLRALYRIAEEAVSPSVSLEQLLQRILDLAIEVVGADRGCVLLTDPESGELVPRVFSHRGEVDVTTRMPVSRTIVEYVLSNGQGVRTSDARRDSRFAAGRSIVQAGIREAICVPMPGHAELLGVVYVDITRPPDVMQTVGAKEHHFSEDHLRLMITIGRQTALAVENQRYHEALVKAERLAAMGQTIATLSHHIKNILQGVRGGSYLIDVGLNSHDEELVRKGWAIVEKNQTKIYNLVMDMLTFSKERQPALEPASLAETVGDVCELMQARAEECGVRLEWRIQPEIPESTFDPEGIHRAVLNIVSNAIDAVEGREQGRVEVEAGWDPQEGTLFVAVTDNGPGIDEDRLSRIFNVFESTKGARGTGLGLAVSRKIIREHGGEITVQSRPGEGARFELRWPRIEEEQPPPVERKTMS